MHCRQKLGHGIGKKTEKGKKVSLQSVEKDRMRGFINEYQEMGERVCSLFRKGWEQFKYHFAKIY